MSFKKEHQFFYEKESSVTGETEVNKITAKNTTDDANTNAEDNEIIHKYKEKVVTIEEERNTLEYQEILNLDIENIASTSQQIRGSINEVIHDDYFKAVKLFPTKILDYYLKNKNVKNDEKRLRNKGYMHKWL